MLNSEARDRAISNRSRGARKRAKRTRGHIGEGGKTRQGDPVGLAVARERQASYLGSREPAQKVKAGMDGT